MIGSNLRRQVINKQHKRKRKSNLFRQHIYFMSQHLMMMMILDKLGFIKIKSHIKKPYRY